MPLLDPAYPLQLAQNRSANPRRPYGKRQEKVLNRRGCEQAMEEISSWPGYRPTPLLELPGLARAAGVSRLWYKDEGGRFGLGSFKALGGAYAVMRLLAQRIADAGGPKGVRGRQLLAGEWRKVTSAVTVCCATDGNHGRSVAWGAQQFGCACVIFIHAGVSEGRKRAMEAYGAKVLRVSGTYDDSVRTAAEEADKNGWIVVSDTSYEGYMEIPRDVMQGYSVMAEEALPQLAGGPMPTHILIPGGVGGFAAAVAAQFWEALGKDRPRIIVVEPEAADCIYQSVKAGGPAAARGDLETIMAGLSCGEVSLLAWEILEEACDDVLTIPDGAAADCMRLLARGLDGDPPVVAGESAVAGLAGLLLACQQPAVAEALALDGAARVLLFGSEGATDEEVYRRIVGMSPQEVCAA